MQRLEEQRDEIDLRVVFDSIGNFFRGIKRSINNLIAICLRNFLLLLFFVLIGVGLGFAAYYVTKPYYTTSMTLVLADIRNQFVEDQLDKLSGMVGDNNFEAIAERLDISVGAAQQIKKMEFLNLDQVAEDSILTGSPFRIELQLYDSNLFSAMEPAIANYLESNPYFAKQKRIKQRQMESMIGKLKNEIASMDSIKNTVASPRGPVNGFVYGEPLDPSNLYRESISMYQRQVQLEAQLDQLDVIQVVIGFSPQSHPTGPNLIKYLLTGGFFAFILGFIVAVNLEARKRSTVA